MELVILQIRGVSSEGGNKVTQESVEGGSLSVGNAPGRTRIDHRGMEQAPHKMGFPIARANEVPHLIPQSIKAIQDAVIVGVEATQLS